ncbi:CDP-alcohol phosphatidyltransferase family protein [Natronosporangium hydrolyticum]|uniref:Phosphatidylinositol phosphate synthase n=1 Tax=Natronosporangium hydrolyticum TaxID=2811111 RepID=A0A895YLS3_9ACTN|nr:CDP-alcohol phosphatidyltransferase family protein [Natronosporangium hydrolyticum]QSB16922.1 CDP-alcohol phosphatidyltransferase family protein [Natronosporangium hydrolyticum]
MAKIFSGAARVGAGRIVEPLARGLLRLGITPDAVTVFGTLGVLVGAIGFAARGHLVVAALFVAVFALVDTLDGAMARLRGYSTRFGAFLDSSMDRVADAAIFGALAYWFASQQEPATLVAVLICFGAAQITSYVKARAQSLGFDCDVGLAERAERLVLIGVGALATGFGVGWALPAALWLLAAAALFTVGQRMVHVYRQERRAGPEPAEAEADPR